VLGDGKQVVVVVVDSGVVSQVNTIRDDGEHLASM